MQRSAPLMDDRYLERQTRVSIEIQESIIARAKKLIEDPDRTRRLDKSQCPACFYQEPMLAGAAVTHQPCMCCHEVQHYGSTRTNVLCMPCAQANELCVKCGADVHLRTTRTWPKAYSEAK